MRLVLALGGNAMTAPDGTARPADQQAAIARAAEPIADLVAAGHDVVLTHGNGPQVGNLLLKNELAAAVVPPVPLDWCVAQTQASIGVLILDALQAALETRGCDRPVAALVSRTTVHADDPGFTEPTKPIGRWLSAEDAAALSAHGQHFREVPGRGWRRVVASPEPRESLDAPAVEALLGHGYVVVASGGGGVPTVRRDGRLVGVEAVIDKDLTAASLAIGLAAHMLVIATDVPAVVTGWGTPHARALGEVTVDRMRAIARAERFAAGSIGPKVEAVARFVEAAGGIGVITSLDHLGDVVDGAAGTRVVPTP